MQKTKLLVIAITTVAIITAATTSLSAASPVFAKLNCDSENNLCTGGESDKSAGFGTPGGAGGRVETFPEGGVSTQTGGHGGQSPIPNTDETGVGGAGGRVTCVSPGDCDFGSGGSGLHVKGPGGNSLFAPPDK